MGEIRRAHKIEAAFVYGLKAKLHACETASEVCRLAMKACGGIAYSGKLSVQRHFRDAHAGKVMALTSDMLLDMVGRSALGMPLL